MSPEGWAAISTIGVAIVGFLGVYVQLRATARNTASVKKTVEDPMTGNVAIHELVNSRAKKQDDTIESLRQEATDRNREYLNQLELLRREILTGKDAQIARAESRADIATTVVPSATTGPAAPEPSRTVVPPADGSITPVVLPTTIVDAEKLK